VFSLMSAGHAAASTCPSVSFDDAFDEVFEDILDDSLDKDSGSGSGATTGVGLTDLRLCAKVVSDLEGDLSIGVVHVLSLSYASNPQSSMASTRSSGVSRVGSYVMRASFS
jgi:hypothetical protein